MSAFWESSEKSSRPWSEPDFAVFVDFGGKRSPLWYYKHWITAILSSESGWLLNIWGGNVLSRWTFCLLWWNVNMLEGMAVCIFADCDFILFYTNRTAEAFVSQCAKQKYIICTLSCRDLSSHKMHQRIVGTVAHTWAVNIWLMTYLKLNRNNHIMIQSWKCQDWVSVFDIFG